MSLAISAARASYEDGNWCGTKPGPRPHFDLASQATRFEAIALNPQPLPPKADGGFGHQATAAFSEDGPRCGNEPKHFHWPPPPPSPLGDLVGNVSHQVMNLLMR
jgi:hypothetical protein